MGHGSDKRPAKYIPAFRFGFLTRFYDTLLPGTVREFALKRRLVEEMSPLDGKRVLDIGCGTGTLALMIKKEQPGADVTGIDGDPEILRIAGDKIEKEGVRISLKHGMSFELPFPDGYFDTAVSSLMIHHLTHENKIRTFREAYRALKPGGEMHVADFGKPAGLYSYLLSLILRWFEEVSDNLNGKLPEMMREAGFGDVKETVRFHTVFGTVYLYRARKM